MKINHYKRWPDRFSFHRKGAPAHTHATSVSAQVLRCVHHLFFPRPSLCWYNIAAGSVLQLHDSSSSFIDGWLVGSCLRGGNRTRKFISFQPEKCLSTKVVTAYVSAGLHSIILGISAPAGVAIRNRPDKKFARRWSQDGVTWSGENIHRRMNSAGTC